MIKYRNVLILLIFPFGLLWAQEDDKSMVDSLNLKKGNEFHQLAEEAYSSNPDSTIVYLHQAIPFFKKSNDKERYITELLTLSAVLQAIGRFDDYRKNAIFTLEETRSLIGEEHVLYAGALNNLNSYYYDQGDFDQSIDLLKKSILIYRKIESGNKFLTKAMSNLANSLTKAGDYTEALNILEQVRLIQEKEAGKTGNDLVKLLRVYNDIAWNCGLKGELDLAADYYRRSIGLIKNNKSLSTDLRYRNPVIRTFQGATEIAIQQGKEKEALAFITDALALQDAKNAFRKAKSFELRGDVFRLQGKPQQALAAYQEGRRLAEITNSSIKRSDLANKYTRIAEVFAVLNEKDSSLVSYQKALQVLAPGFVANDPGKNPEVEILLSKNKALTILAGKGALLWDIFMDTKDEQRLSQSFESYLFGIAVINDIRQGVLTTEAKNTLSEKTIPIYEGAIRAALALHQSTQQNHWLEQALTLAESNKSLLLLESVNEQAALGIQGLPDSLLQKDKALRLRIAFYQKKLIEAQSKKEKANAKRITAWKKQVFDLKGELQSLTDHFEAAYPRFYQLKYQNEKPDLAAWQKELANNNQALIEYFVGEENSYGFVLWKDGLEYFELAQKEIVFNAIGQLRNSISQLPADAEVLQNYQAFAMSSHLLYQTLLAPALAVLPQEITALKIIPDDQLNYIPFDLLLMETAPRDQAVFSAQQLAYVLKQYSVSYDYSATWMLKNVENKNLEYQQDFIAYAPSFKKAAIADGTRALRACQESELYDLECSREEAKGINALMKGETRLNQAALKSSFAQEAGKYRIIHMATHACADEANPLFNKIFLSDDYLSNADLYHTELNAELVVLSACNTGSGRLVKGEGVLSLARGFVQAGCASSVVSRWSVDDCTTSDIMYRFYEGLHSGETKDEALRQAKLQYLAQADQFYAHPYFWSAFVAYGEMDAMDLGSGFSVYLWAFIGLLFLALVFFFGKRFAQA